MFANRSMLGRRARVGILLLAIGTCLPSGVLAQNTPLDRRTDGSGQVTTPAARQRSSFFPKIKLGGVKSKAPRPIGSIKGTLLPPVPPKVVAPKPPSVRHRQDSDDRGNDRPDSRGRSGTREAGGHDDDRFRLRAHIGSPGVPYYYGSTYGYGRYGYGPAYGRYGYPNSYYYDRYQYPPSYVIGYSHPNPYPQQPANGANSVPVVTERELTRLEQADQALREGRSADATQIYREHLKHSPEDAQAMRSLALALIRDKDIREAFAVMQFAYERHPELASKPIRPQDVPSGKRGLRSMLLSVVPLANRTKGASGYLTEVVIMQAEGRLDHARRLLKRAREAGLNEAAANELERALNP